MDYKELIDKLRGEAFFIRVNGLDGWSTGFSRAADVIETLLEERDAAIREIAKGCDNCKYSDLYAEEEPCRNCHVNFSKWEWCGPMKGLDR